MKHDPHDHGRHDAHDHEDGDDLAPSHEPLDTHAHGPPHAHPHAGHAGHAGGEERAPRFALGHEAIDDGGHAHSHDHPHDHDHDAHSHPHPHSPPHSHGQAHAPSREDLPRGAGLGKILFFDAPSGLAGDMVIAALIDLGVPSAVIADAAAALPISGFHLHVGTAVKSGIVATKLEVHADAAQPERTYATVRSILDASSLSGPVRERAHATFRRLAEAEAKVHRSDIDSVHFHEVGAIDALVDIVGSAAAIDWLGAEIVVSPLPMGRGFVKARHGILPLPAPATVECLRGLPTYDGGLDFEFVTPTGAAIVGAHARGSSRWPAMTPERVGWGAGTASLKDRPNLLRAVLGTPVSSASAGESPAGDEAAETHTVIEANLDDASGELLGEAIASLLAQGALDAWATPITMKKGRPAFTISVLARAADGDRLSHAVLRETTSIGVRRYPVSRVERPRRMIEVDTPYGRIPVKIAEGPFGPPQIKPELDACAAAARAHQVPLREVIRAALSACT